MCVCVCVCMCKCVCVLQVLAGVFDGGQIFWPRPGCFLLSLQRRR